MSMNVRALFFQLDGAGKGAVGVEIFSAVGERIGRDVEHADDQGTLAEVQRPVAEFPFESLTGRTFKINSRPPS